MVGKPEDNIRVGIGITRAIGPCSRAVCKLAVAIDGLQPKQFSRTSPLDQFANLQPLSMACLQPKQFSRNLNLPNFIEYGLGLRSPEAEFREFCVERWKQSQSTPICYECGFISQVFDEVLLSFSMIPHLRVPFCPFFV